MGAPVYQQMPWNEAYVSNDDSGVAKNTQFYTTYDMKKMDVNDETVYDESPKLENHQSEAK